jgi:hypothetical protein
MACINVECFNMVRFETLALYLYDGLVWMAMLMCQEVEIHGCGMRVANNCTNFGCQEWRQSPGSTIGFVDSSLRLDVGCIIHVPTVRRRKKSTFALPCNVSIINPVPGGTSL